MRGSTSRSYALPLTVTRMRCSCIGRVSGPAGGLLQRALREYPGEFLPVVAGIKLVSLCGKRRLDRCGALEGSALAPLADQRRFGRGHTARRGAETSESDARFRDRRLGIESDRDSSGNDREIRRAPCELDEGDAGAPPHERKLDRDQYLVRLQLRA